MAEGSQWGILQIWLFSTLPRQLDWSSMMFIESHFYGYPTCLVFAHVVGQFIVDAFDARPVP